MQQQQSKSNYYAIRNKSLACAISYLLDVNYYVMDDINREGKVVYTFEDTADFRQALNYIMSYRKNITENK